jgi:hypothetical protein
MKVRVLVADLAPHDGAGACVKGLFPAPFVQFRGIGSHIFAKGVLLPEQVAGVEVPEGVQVILAPEQFKGAKPRPGEILDLTILARPLVPGKQLFSWQAILFLWAAMETKEEKQALWENLLAETQAGVDRLLAALEQALQGNLHPLATAVEGLEVPSLEALRVFGLTQETTRLLQTWAVHQVADLIRSGGLVGDRLLLVIDEEGAVPDRAGGDLVVVRTPVRRPQGVLTVRTTQKAEAMMRRGVMLLHPSAAQALDGDDDGDFVAVVSEPWVVEASRRLARLDPLFQGAVKAEKKRRDLGTSDEDFAKVRELMEGSAIGLATLALFTKVVQGDWKAAAFWSEQVQLEVDCFKWDVKPFREKYEIASFAWRRTPKDLSSFQRVQPVGKADVVAYLWNHVIPSIQEKAEALAEVGHLGPIDYLEHIKPSLFPPQAHLVERADALAAEWAAEWADLALAYQGEIPDDVVQETRGRWMALGQRMTLPELAAVVACPGSFAFKNALVGMRWTEVCEPRVDARHHHVQGWIQFDGAPVNLGDAFWVRLRRVARGGRVEVVLSANRWAPRVVLGAGQVVGRLGRSFRGRYVRLGELIPGAEDELVIVPAGPAEGTAAVQPEIPAIEVAWNPELEQGGDEEVTVPWNP